MALKTTLTSIIAITIIGCSESGKLSSDDRNESIPSTAKSGEEKAAGEVPQSDPKAEVFSYEISQPNGSPLYEAVLRVDRTNPKASSIKVSLNSQLKELTIAVKRKLVNSNLGFINENGKIGGHCSVDFNTQGNVNEQRIEAEKLSDAALKARILASFSSIEDSLRSHLSLGGMGLEAQSLVLNRFVVGSEVRRFLSQQVGAEFRSVVETASMEVESFKIVGSTEKDNVLGKYSTKGLENEMANLLSGQKDALTESLFYSNSFVCELKLGFKNLKIKRENGQQIPVKFELLF